MTYAISQMWDGPRIEAVKGGFPRKSAALAYLIDDLNAKGATAIYHELDADHDAYDILAVFGSVAYQYMIEVERG